MQKMHVLVHIGFRKRLGECAIQGEVLIPEDPGTELCVCVTLNGQRSTSYCIVRARD